MVAYYYAEDDPPTWWASIDVAAALRERWPDPDTLRQTERAQLGLLVDPAASQLQRIQRAAMTQERDADLFITRMEERTGSGAAHKRRLAEKAAARAVARREAWVARMKERGFNVNPETN